MTEIPNPWVTGDIEPVIQIQPITRWPLKKPIDELDHYLRLRGVVIECSEMDFFLCRLWTLRVEHNAGTGKSYFIREGAIVAIAQLYGE